jgi:hypothetical protein
MLDAGEKQGLVVAITHETREVVGQARQIGPKSSEIPVVRALLRETGLEKQKGNCPGASSVIRPYGVC